MTTRIELVMLQKTIVVVEEVARKLDPQLNMWSTAELVVGDRIADDLGPPAGSTTWAAGSHLRPPSLLTLRAASTTSPAASTRPRSPGSTTASTTSRRSCGSPTPQLW